MLGLAGKPRHARAGAPTTLPTATAPQAMPATPRCPRFRPCLILTLTLTAAALAWRPLPAAAEPPVAAGRSGLPWPAGFFTSSGTTRAAEAWRGRPFDVETSFFGHLTWAHMTSSAATLRTKLPSVPGRLALALGMLPTDHAGRLEECAAGLFDPLIRSVTAAILANGGGAAAATGKPILLRLGWEANNANSYPWGATGDGSSWRACFRRWVDILNPITDPATSPPTRQRNFLIVWNMANRGSLKLPIENLWPGGDVVDIVGSQFYDRCPPLPEGDEAEWARRLVARDPLGNPAGPLAWLEYARSKGKPYAVPEWGIGGPRDICARPGTDNPYFVRKMHGLFQAIAPELAFESYFNGHGFTDDSKGSHKLFAPDPGFPDPGSPDYLAYAQRYHPHAAATYRALWSQDLALVTPEISVMPLAAAAPEGHEGWTALTFTITRTGNPGAAVGASWRVSGGTAGLGDFAGGAFPAGTVSLAAGETSQTVTVLVAGDLSEEGDETFTLALDAPTGGASIGTASAAGAILNDDLESARFALAPSTVARGEGQEGTTTAFSFTVTRSGGTRRPASVGWGVAGGGADAADFAGGAFPAGTVTFGAGQIKRTITVQVQGDAEIELDESFEVTLADPSGDGLIDAGASSGTIRNDDHPSPVLEVAVLAAARAEGQGGTSPFTFRVSRSGDARPAVSAAWRVTGGSADAGDFAEGVLPSGTVSLAAGQTSKTVTVAVRGDRQVGADETFGLALSDPTGGASIETGAASATILNDDAEPTVLTVAALTVSADEGNSGTTAFAFQVTRSGDAGQAVSVKWQAGNGGTDPADFAGGALPSGTVSLAPGGTAATLTIGIQGDTRVEAEESFAVTLSDPTGGARLGTAAATAAVRNDDVEPATLSLAALDAAKPEGDGGPTPFTFTVARSGDGRRAVSVAWSVVGIGADAADFAGAALPSGIFWLAARETSRTLTVRVQGNGRVEPDEAFQVVLSSPTGGAVLGAAAAATGVILNDDAEPPSLAIAAVAAAADEGNGGATPFAFGVTRSGDTRQAVAVTWRVVPGTADASDFAGGALPAGTVSLAPGETAATLTVPVLGEARVEADETFAVALSNPTGGARLGVATASAAIRNDDAEPATLSLVALDAAKPEGDAGATLFVFGVTRSGDSRGAVGAAWRVAGPGADAADFAGAAWPSGTVTLAAGETATTVTVRVQGDRQVEPDETFAVTLSAPTGGAVIGAGTAAGAIRNDDAEAPSLAVAAVDAATAEGTGGTTPFTFAVTRSGDARRPVRIGWRVFGRGPSPAAAADFAGGRMPAGTLAFAAGETRKVLAVAVAGDARRENAEGFGVALSDPPPGAKLGAASAHGTILDDDR